MAITRACIVYVTERLSRFTCFCLQRLAHMLPARRRAAPLNDWHGLAVTAIALTLAWDGGITSHDRDLDLDPMTFIYELDLYLWRCTCVPEMNVVGRGFRYWELYRHTNRCDQASYHSRLVGGRMNAKVTHHYCDSDTACSAGLPVQERVRTKKNLGTEVRAEAVGGGLMHEVLQKLNDVCRLQSGFVLTEIVDKLAH